VLYGATDYDVDLSDRKRIEELALELPHSAIWHSSPMLRARRTLGAVANASSFDFGQVKISKLLSEQSYGDLEGLSMKSVFERYPESSRFGKVIDNHDFKPPGGESYSQLIKRVESWIEQNCQSPQAEHVVFCHRGIIQAFQIIVGANSGVELWHSSIPHLSCHKIQLGGASENG
tara:strand:+ start:1633 stop:2157 length:525 start_codon:yes stop_codon:yes gene_type:complete